MATQTQIQEVDIRNYADVKVAFEQAVKQSTFIAFDCEFTGLHKERQQGTNVLQSVKSRYAGIRQTMFGGAIFVGKCHHCGVDLIDAANYCHHCGNHCRRSAQRQEPGARQQDFLICQVGLACFTRLETGAYSVRVFSFYLSPRPFSTNAEKGGNVRISHDIRFGALGSSLKFLGDHNFDFTRWVNDGLPFMSRQLWQQEREKMQQRGQFDMSELEKGRGFLDVWDCVLAAGKPLVGHQSFLDILYLWHQLEAPLHRDLTEVIRDFARRVRVTVDTKHLLTHYPRALSALFENTGLAVRQRKLLRLRKSLERKVQLRDQRRQAEKAADADGTRGASPAAESASRPSTPPPAVPSGAVSPPPKTSPSREDTTEPPRCFSPRSRGSKEDERSELLRKQTDALDELRELHCGLLQRSLGEGDTEGNRFRTMQLQDVHKLVWPFVQDTVPAAPAQREHDAGYDAWMTGCLFLSLFSLIHSGREVVPSAKSLLDYHSKSDATAALDSPSAFSFVNRVFVFAAPYYLDTTASKLPSIEETHVRTFVVEPEGATSERVEIPRLQRELRGVDPYSDLYWVDYAKKAVVVLTKNGRSTKESDDLEEACKMLRELLAAFRPLNLKVTPVSSRVLKYDADMKARAAAAAARSAARAPASAKATAQPAARAAASAPAAAATAATAKQTPATQARPPAAAATPAAAAPQKGLGARFMSTATGNQPVAAAKPAAKAAARKAGSGGATQRAAATPAAAPAAPSGTASTTTPSPSAAAPSAAAPSAALAATQSAKPAVRLAAGAAGTATATATGDGGGGAAKAAKRQSPSRAAQKTPGQPQTAGRTLQQATTPRPGTPAAGQQSGTGNSPPRHQARVPKSPPRPPAATEAPRSPLGPPPPPKRRNVVVAAATTRAIIRRHNKLAAQSKPQTGQKRAAVRTPHSPPAPRRSSLPIAADPPAKRLRTA
eukprot:TRINITY_DN3626_c0_g1_i1.p1 TRINITY_DN3626_c0_g1~~TRINITY_DN3626_c0_g1_i1.p1  ORF type:complete len:950 (+),score=248.00 TRINITY_DN3626_c0_g1_i1:104-2953(+)